MKWMIMPNSTALNRKSVRFTVYHPNGIASLRFAKNERLLQNKKEVAGDTFQIRTNGAYILEARTQTGETLKRQFSVTFLDTQPVFAGGEGTEEHPYLIETAQQLNAMRAVPSAHFRLVCDIDLSAPDWGIGWWPIGECRAIQEKPGEWEGVLDHTASFSGDFDGNNHRISNACCYAPKKVYVGFWGFVEGNIHNICLEDCFFSGDMIIGCIAGGLCGRIYGCSARGKAEGKFDVGGIAGMIMWNKFQFAEDPMQPFVQIEECGFFGSLCGRSCIGGIAGDCDGGSANSVIRNCFVDAELRAITSAAGIIGGQPQRIENCFATGEIRMESTADRCFVLGIGSAFQYKLPFCESKVNWEVCSCVSAWRKISFKGDEVCNPLLFGRISHINYDVTHSPYERSNLALDTMQIINEARSIPISDLSLQNGVSVSKETLMKRDTYIRLGWDLDIWEVTDGVYPRIKTIPDMDK